MTRIETPGLLTFTISIVVFFAGAGVNRLIPSLRNWNIPDAVTGGLLASLATLAAHALGFEISFDLEARDMLLLYFFTAIGLNAKLADLVAGGRPLIVLLGLTLAYLVIQNLIAAGAAAALHLPPGVTPLLGSASLLGGHGTVIAWAPVISDCPARSKSASPPPRSALSSRASSADRQRNSSSRGAGSPVRSTRRRRLACPTRVPPTTSIT